MLLAGALLGASACAPCVPVARACSHAAGAARQGYELAGSRPPKTTMHPPHHCPLQTLAEQLGICEDIAHEKAAYWRSLSLPLASYFQCAKAAAAPYVPIKPSTARPAAVGAGQWVQGRALCWPGAS